MSMHKKPLTDFERNGLRAHGLPRAAPSQLSDCFRSGIAWAGQRIAELEEREAALAAQVELLLAAGDLLREPWDLSNILGPETRRRVEGWDKAKERVETPTTSLASSEKIKQAGSDPHPDCELECGAYGTYCKCAAEQC